MGTLVRAMENTGAALGGTNVVNAREKNWGAVRERLEQPCEPGETTHRTNEQALNDMLTIRSPLGCIGGVIMRRDLIGETRFRSDLFIGEDYFFIYENLIKGAAAEFLKQNWYYVRNHKNNSSWNYGYDGFYTRFLRRKLVWENEDASGRPEHAKGQKREVVAIYISCVGQKNVSEDDRKKMRLVMKQHRKAIVPALSAPGKLQYFLSVYTPTLYNHPMFARVAKWRKKAISLVTKALTKQTAAQTQDKTTRDIETKVAVKPKNYELLNRFLSMSVSTGEQVFSEFETLPGAVFGRGETDLERFVYVPGTRQDRVLLVAHADTVWDAEYGKSPSETSLAFQDGIFYSTDPKRGIGADDRAGCAMLYALRDSGHSLLVLGGEERGKKGAWYLRKHKPELFKELNGHRFMIEFDWCGTNGCLFNQVDYSNKFKKYIEQELGFSDSKKDGGCDLQVLCQKVCGVNVGVGNHTVHSPKETLVLAEWENTYNVMISFLQKEQARFPIHKGRRLLTHLRRLKSYPHAVKRRIKKLLTH